MGKNTYRILVDRQASCCCPTCGQKIPEADLRVDLQTNTISANGLVIKALPRIAEFIEVLRRGFPHFVPRETIIARVWANDAQDRVVDVNASRGRVLLKKIGWGIDSYRHSGYRLFKIDPQKVPDCELANKLG